MSDYQVIIVPDDADFVPEERKRQSAWHAIAHFVPEVRVTVEVSETPVFVDAGENWDGVRCPACNADLDGDSWWLDHVDHASKAGFTDLKVKTPCCGKHMSLNDLHYPWQVAFARFRLVIDDPIDGVPVGVVSHVSKIIGRPVRVVHRHL